MAKTKAELLAEAKKLGVEVDEKAKVAEIRALIDKTLENEAETATPEEATDAAKTAEAQEEPQVAKAGKRSAKALAEEAEKQAKEERKAQTGKETEAKPKKPVKPTRSRLERRGKNFRKAAEQIEKNKQYSLKEAVELAAKTSPTKFDATVELHINLNVDPRQADQNIRGSLILPAGSGKTVRVAVFDDEKVANADISGTEAIAKMIEKGQLEFDVLVSTPANMSKLGKHARTLGPRGLMPNPKSGTVTTDLNKAVAEAKAGRVEYRVDSTGIVHLGVGKASFTSADLQKNVESVLTNIQSSKPSSVKGVFVKSAHLTTSMGPSVKLNSTEL